MTSLVVGGVPSLVRDVVSAVLSESPALDLQATLSSPEEVDRACAGQATVAVFVLFGPDEGFEAAVSEVLHHGVRVVVVTHGVNAEHLQRLLLAGAGAVLPFSRIDSGELVAAVTEVASSGASLHPVVAAAVLEQWRQLRSSAAPAPIELTARERDVLEGLVAGQATKEIARALGLSPKTVESHQARLFQKLGARNRAQAVSVALEQGLVTQS